MSVVLGTAYEKKTWRFFPERKSIFTSSSVTTVLCYPADFLGVLTFSFSSRINSGIPTFNSSLALTLDTETSVDYFKQKIDC